MSVTYQLLLPVLIINHTFSTLLTMVQCRLLRTEEDLNFTTCRTQTPVWWHPHRTQSSRWHSSSLLCLPDSSSCHFTFSLRCDCKFVGFQWLSSNLADYSLVEMAWACHCHNLKNGPAATVMYCIIGWEAVRLSVVTSFEIIAHRTMPLTHRALISGMNGTKL